MKLVLQLHSILKWLYQESERSGIFVLVGSILPPSTIFRFDFGIVPRACYFCFSFYYSNTR